MDTIHSLATVQAIVVVSPCNASGTEHSFINITRFTSIILCPCMARILNVNGSLLADYVTFWALNPYRAWSFLQWRPRVCSVLT